MQVVSMQMTGAAVTAPPDHSFYGDYSMDKVSAMLRELPTAGLFLGRCRAPQKKAPHRGNGGGLGEIAMPTERRRSNDSGQVSWLTVGKKIAPHCMDNGGDKNNKPTTPLLSPEAPCEYREPLVAAQASRQKSAPLSTAERGLKGRLSAMLRPEHRRPNDTGVVTRVTLGKKIASCGTQTGRGIQERQTCQLLPERRQLPAIQQVGPAENGQVPKKKTPHCADSVGPIKHQTIAMPNERRQVPEIRQVGSAENWQATDGLGSVRQPQQGGCHHDC